MRKEKCNIRKVKFTPQEMAYEAPDEVDFSTGPVFQGMEQWRKYLSWKRGYAKLDPDVRKAFPNDRSVNKVLKKVLELRQMTIGKKRSA